MALNPSPEFHDLGGFQNDIPSSESMTNNETGTNAGFWDASSKTGYIISQDATRSPLSADSSSTDTKKARDYPHDEPCEGLSGACSPQGVFRNIVWSAFAICGPMMLLCGALMYIAFVYRIKKISNVFGDNATQKQEFEDISYILVDFSATKLVFLASFLSTLAPLLAGCIMTITSMIAFEDLRRTSDVSRFQRLPTPYQMSLLVGVLAASYEQLLTALTYLSSRRRKSRASPILIYAISIFLLSVLLGVAVTIADAFLHVITETVQITTYSDPQPLSHLLGRGLNAYCLGVNRIIDNYGFPCSYAMNTDIAVNPGFTQGRTEIQRIAHNTSSAATMQLGPATNIDGRTIAYLLPEITSIPEGINYQATTLGVAAQCFLIPPTSCNLTRWGPNGAFYTNFNCSSQFYGILGMPPLNNAINTVQTVSSNTSFLMINQNANLFYNYFTDSDLEIVYNTADLDASADQPDDAQPWPDSRLQSTVYMAFAWRTAIETFGDSGPGSMAESDQVEQYDNTSYVDYFVNCEVTSYNVTYSWINGSLGSLQAFKHDNGSVLDIWTGMADYRPTVSGGDWNLQDYNVQSAIAGNTTSTYVQRFGELISLDALASIGAYTSGRQVLLQQMQKILLVAKVPKAALGGLLACSLLYPVLGVVLIAKIVVVSKKRGPLMPLFSYWDLASAAFLANTVEHNSEQKRTQTWEDQEVYRVLLRNHKNQGHRFLLRKQSSSGHINDIQKSRTDIASWI